MVANPRELVGGLVFPESPRWFDDRLYFVDMFAHKVMTADLEGRVDLVRRFDDRPSGIGFLPDGTGLVVLMASKRIVDIASGELYADLSDLPGDYLNDMVVDARGMAYVDHLGKQAAHGLPASELGDAVVAVEPGGRSYSCTAGQEVHRPNGLAISEDGARMIVAMNPRHQLVEYAIGVGGDLTSPTVFADIAPYGLDGICLDSEDAVWVASPRAHEFVRVRRGGKIVDRIVLAQDTWAVACVLGGPSRTHLFLATTRVPSNPRSGLDGNLHLSSGGIQVAEVSVPGTGVP